MYYLRNSSGEREGRQRNRGWSQKKERDRKILVQQGRLRRKKGIDRNGAGDQGRGSETETHMQRHSERQTQKERQGTGGN